MRIPSHQRENYERTDDLLNRLRALLTALDRITFALPIHDDDGEAVLGLIATIREKMDEIEKARAMEWVGLGGVSQRLTGDEA